jgi:translation initiation factor 2 subunit 2
MLDEVYKSLPEKSLKKERFEIPKMDSFVQGNRTVVRNFEAAMKIVQREPKHALKYITKQTATAASIDNGQLILKGRFSHHEIQRMFDEYVKRFVLCHVCGRPDTRIIEQHGVKVMKCTACGAISAIKE